MITEEQLKKLHAENALLKNELDDVNMMISVREEELELLRQRAQEATELRSKLQGNLNAFEQMQNQMGSLQQKPLAASSEWLSLKMNCTRR